MSSDQSIPKISTLLPSPAVFVMLMSLFYWSYLALTSQAIIFHDSIGYQALGALIINHPWQDYFITGPNREPLYPLLISLSMRIAQWMNGDYLAVQMIFQVTILSLTQFLTAIVFKRLQISDGLSAFGLAYMAFSPTLVNSGLILYSEILTYPLIIWLIFRAARAWSEIKTAPLNRVGSNAIFLGAASLSVIFTKGIFEFISFLLLTPYLILLWKADRELQKRIGVFFIVFFLTLQIPLVTYKFINKTYNGVYALTDRGGRVLYGETARRMLPIDAKLLQAAVAFIPGSDVCQYFHKDNCFRWGTSAVNPLITKKNEELTPHIKSRQEHNDALIREGVREAFKNPLQYIFLTTLEGIKIFFWEAQETYLVVYPDSVARFYNNPWLRYPLRFLLALMSFLALVYGMMKVYKDRNNIFRSQKGPDEKISLEFYLVFLITVYACLAAISYITARYTQPVIPLFCAVIFFSIQDLIDKKGGLRFFRRPNHTDTKKPPPANSYKESLREQPRQRPSQTAG